MKRIVGWILTVIGVPLTSIFAVFTLFYLGRGPYGIIIAIYFTGPLFLIGVAFTVFGAHFRNRSLDRNRPRPPLRNGVVS